ncbi:hypothetical protein PE066_03500 [Ramlibacter tataouinensis]|uniref:hypothetical protein n=1 Tax=Ramlibacter tataouinensis TaxID=94132 RepID=UPI0022F38573|nr:hypothetical protein [Ramlibacter tataouinensis]WBY02615.1 hypothetical protein PE066_03500 [Ramlibacter tataouinensis]
MNSETSSSPFPTSTTTGTTGATGSASTGGTDAGGMGADSGRVQRLAQSAHEAVDRLEQTLSSGSDKMMGWQQEYGDMARDQVRENPLAALGVAFAVGIIFSKLFMR